MNLPLLAIMFVLASMVFVQAETCCCEILDATPACCESQPTAPCDCPCAHCLDEPMFPIHAVGPAASKSGIMPPEDEPKKHAPDARIPTLAATRDDDSVAGRAHDRLARYQAWRN